jgi:hypothetical protein
MFIIFKSAEVREGAAVVEAVAEAVAVGPVSAVSAAIAARFVSS